MNNPVLSPPILRILPDSEQGSTASATSQQAAAPSAQSVRAPTATSLKAYRVQAGYATLAVLPANPLRVSAILRSDTTEIEYRVGGAKGTPQEATVDLGMLVEGREAITVETTDEITIYRTLGPGNHYIQVLEFLAPINQSQ